MRSLLVLGLVVLSMGSTAQADWNGYWMGEIRYTNDINQDEMVPDEVAMIDDGATISLAESIWGQQFTFDIVNGDVMLDGNKVGAVTADKFEVSFDLSADPANPCLQVYTMSQMADGSVEYVDDFRCSDGYFDRLEGMLAPVRK